MKIGLVRHFKVKHAYPKNMLLSHEEVMLWFEGYEAAEIDPAHVDLNGIEFRKCFTSSSNRALKTAGIIFKGEKTVLHELRELDVLPIMKSNRKLPFLMWAILVRIKSSTSNKITDEFRNSILTFLDDLLSKNSEDILIVSHGFVMMLIQKELKRRGFEGNGFSVPKNGKLYVYQSPRGFRSEAKKHRGENFS